MLRIFDGAADCSDHSNCVAGMRNEKIDRYCPYESYANHCNRFFMISLKYPQDNKSENSSNNDNGREKYTIEKTIFILRLHCLIMDYGRNFPVISSRLSWCLPDINRLVVLLVGIVTHDFSARTVLFRNVLKIVCKTDRTVLV
jgi:hypothetical protein